MSLLQCCYCNEKVQSGLQNIIDHMDGTVVTFKERPHQWYLPVDTLHENSIIMMIPYLEKRKELSQLEEQFI